MELREIKPKREIKRQEMHLNSRKDIWLVKNVETTALIGENESFWTYMSEKRNCNYKHLNWN